MRGRERRSRLSLKIEATRGRAMKKGKKRLTFRNHTIVRSPPTPVALSRPIVAASALVTLNTDEVEKGKEEDEASGGGVAACRSGCDDVDDGCLAPSEQEPSDG